MLNFVIWIVVGGIIGWIASMLVRTHEGPLLNIIVGIVGAFIAGLLLTPVFGITTINQANFSLPALLVSLLGAVLLLAAISFVRRLSIR
jgi:uncharacterized membrane protein YeaQ/YmgE (transglycosylase-associated protein family)